MDKKLECSSGGPVDVASGCGLRIRLWEFLPAVDVATGCGRRYRLWASLPAVGIASCVIALYHYHSPGLSVFA